MSYDVDRLYELLPAIYRLRDAQLAEQLALLSPAEEAELNTLLASAASLDAAQAGRLRVLQDRRQSGPLRALLGVISEQIAVLEEDLAQLYDDQFIETCAEWALPYIGDLIGYRALYGVTPQVSSPRAEVANTIGYRQRKGTAAMLEQVARDVTGWPARVVEFFQLLATTQYLNHLRPANRATPDLRQIEPLERVNTPFDGLSHTADVRRIAAGRGRHNIPNVGIFVWRLREYPITKGSARQVQAGVGCYTFNPLGIDAPLFNLPRSEGEITQLAEPANVPEPLRRRPLYHELEARRQAIADGQAPADVERGVYFGGRPVLRVFTVTGADSTEIPADEILICDLSDPPAPLPTLWRRPPASKEYQPADPAQPAVTLPIRVAVDPVLGRLAFPDDTALTRVEVSYAYGFSADMGGGPYLRSELPPAVTLPAEPGDALAALAALGGDSGVVELVASLTIDGDLTITLAAEQRLRIQAENGERPVLNGRLTVVAAAGAELTLDGLLIAGGIEVSGTDRFSLLLRDTTLPPWLETDAGKPKPLTAAALAWNEAGSGGTLRLERVISGYLRLGEGVAAQIEDSIVDALGDDVFAVAASDDGAAAGKLEMSRSTVFGALRVREAGTIENSICTGRVVSERKQQGCIRFSYLPVDSDAPRCFRCQPRLAMQDAVDAARRKQPLLSSAAQTAIESEVAARIRPAFTDPYYGRPGYAQLADCPDEIRAGAEDGCEQGAFHDLFQARRAANLRIRLDEYLRFGLEAGILFVS